MFFRFILLDPSNCNLFSRFILLDPSDCNSFSRFIQLDPSDCNSFFRFTQCNPRERVVSIEGTNYVNRGNELCNSRERIASREIFTFSFFLKLPKSLQGYRTFLRRMKCSFDCTRHCNVLALIKTI